MAEITDLNIVDASNTARMPENQAPSTVNNGVRALEGILARGFKDAVEGTINSAGGTTAYTVAANRTISAYYDGLRQGFHVNAVNTGAVTLNIDSVGAKDVRKNADKALVAGDWITDQYVEVVFSATDDRFQMQTPVAIPSLVGDGTADRVLRCIDVIIQNGSDATTIKPSTTDVWNGDANSAENNLVKGGDTGVFTLTADGIELGIETAGFTGTNAVVLAATIKRNASGTNLTVWHQMSGLAGTLLLNFRNSTTGDGVDLTTLVDTGDIEVGLLYLTDG